MINVGIVSEYNPIHWGHIYQIEMTRSTLGSEVGIISIMSGNFVQRGDFAIYDKWARAQAAVLCGADLVVELPLPYVLSSAEHFAAGAVSIMNIMGVVTHLSFGSESGKIEDITRIAEALLNNNNCISDIIKSGKSYAVACQEAAVSILGKECGEIIRSPNNILGIEYIKALKRSGSDIVPLTIQRKGSGHDSLLGEERFASAAYIRSQMKNGVDIASYISPEAFDVFKVENEAGRGPIYMENAEQAILALLRFMDESDFSKIADISEGIENRLMKYVRSEVTVKDIIQKTKSKRYPESRIRRMILAACLGLKDGDRTSIPPYIKILASSNRGRRIIRDMTLTSPVPIITKPAKIKKLAESARRMFFLESIATDLYVLASPNAKNRKGRREWREGPRIK